MEAAKEKRIVVITGFGPFKHHIINASWEAVKILLNSCNDLESSFNIKIIGLEVPVAYKSVSELIPKLWKEHKPLLVIHVGVSSAAKILTIESTAHGSGYVKPDIHEELPNENELQTVIYHTEIDVKQLANSTSNNFEESGCKAIVSHDAGRYLCEYIYYKSLSVDSSRTLFIHVPDMHVYASEQSAKGLHYIVNYLLKNLKS